MNNHTKNMVRRRHYIRLSFLPLILLWAFRPVHGAATIKRKQQGGDQDDETISIRLPQQMVELIEPKETKYSIRMPSRLLRLSEKVKTLNDGRNRLFVTVTDRENEATQATQSRKPFLSEGSNSRGSQAQVSPIMHGGLALLAISSFVFTTHGYNALKEVATSSLCALALVWVPTFVVHGGWAELFSVGTLMAQPDVRRFMVREFLPKALNILKKLFLTEVWRRVWAVILAPLPKPLLVPSELDIMRIGWLPDWMKEGCIYFRDRVDNFALSTVKSSVQKSVHGTIGIFFDSFSGSVLEVSMIYEDAMNAHSERTAVDEIVGSTVDDNVESDNHEPQLICDGDTCRFE